MAEDSTSQNHTEPVYGNDDSSGEGREKWFTSSPDPWKAITELQHDGDRTFASTLERMVMSAEPGQHPAMEQRLLAALQEPGITDAGIFFVCRMLALVGSAASVPVVARLLKKNETAHAARFALDEVADPAVDAAYRDALVKLSGAEKCGLIGSIARRGDVAAIDALTVIALDEREERVVRETAERAIERLVLVKGTVTK